MTIGKSFVIELKQKAAAEAFLGKHRAVMSDKLRKSVVAEGRETNNYLYTGASMDDLVAALDSEWPGPSPHTILVDNDGKVIFRHTGIVHSEKLTTAILDTLTHYHTTPIPKRKARKKRARSKTLLNVVNC